MQVNASGQFCGVAEMVGTVDGFSQMTPILDNSLISQKEKLSRMRSDECLYIFLI